MESETKPTPDKQIKIPKAIAAMLYEDETAIASIRQSRLRKMFTPDSIFITNHRIILYSPHTLGLRKTIEDYKYEDMANFKVDRGIFFSTIKITQRFMSNDFVLDNLPNGKIDNIARIIHEYIRQYGNGAKPRLSASTQSAEPQADDPLKVLKLRFARGEISQKEFEEMKRLLD
jgi:hypothetical protein